MRITEKLILAASKGGELSDPTKEGQKGLFWTPEGIYVVAAFDILNSEETGPRHGTLIMATLVNDVITSKIEKIITIYKK